MYAMMQCQAKSENLAHILGYQIWAVTGGVGDVHTPPYLVRLGALRHNGRADGFLWRHCPFFLNFEHHLHFKYMTKFPTNLDDI